MGICTFKYDFWCIKSGGVFRWAVTSEHSPIEHVKDLLKKGALVNVHFAECSIDMQSSFIIDLICSSLP